jgi:hypothetical protein
MGSSSLVQDHVQAWTVNIVKVVELSKVVNLCCERKSETRRQREGFCEPIRRAQKQDAIYLV